MRMKVCDRCKRSSKDGWLGTSFWRFELTGEGISEFNIFKDLCSKCKQDFEAWMREVNE